MPAEYIPNHDEALLNSLGYAQELKREFNSFQIFSVAFSIMVLVPAISTVFADGLEAGPLAITWGWLVPCVFIASVGVSLGELASSYPTSGGLYYWVRRPASFLCAYANTLGLLGILCSINSGFADLLLSVPAIGVEGYAETKYEKYGVFCAVLIVQCLLNLLPSHILSRFQMIGTTLNLVLVVLVCIATPIGASKHGGLNSGRWVFTEKANDYTGYAWFGAFLLSWQAVIWVISAFDSCIHMSEEASNASRAVPKGILMAIGICSILGFAVQSILAACIRDGDLERIAGTATGQPVAQIFLDSLGKKWAMGLMSLLAFAMLLAGTSTVTAASRQTYSVARDGVLPFSRFVRQINFKTAVPHVAIVFDCVVAAVMGLLILIDTTAATALFSIGVSSNALSWMLPVFFRFFFPKANHFTAGPFYIGKTLSWINNGITVLWLTFVVFVLTMLPVQKPVDKTTMNYTCVINAAIWIGSLLYYFADARKWFEGPKKTFIDPEINIEKDEDQDSDDFDKNAYRHNIIGVEI